MDKFVTDFRLSLKRLFDFEPGPLFYELGIFRVNQHHLRADLWCTIRRSAGTEGIPWVCIRFRLENVGKQDIK